MPSAIGYHKSETDIVDIRREDLSETLLKLTLQSLQPGDGNAPSLPTLLLYDEIGLKIFEDITYLDEYYLTNAEIQILKNHAKDVAARLPEGSRLIELGSGNLRKINILLKAFEDAKKSVSYFALDLSLPELKRTLSAIPPGTYHFVKCAGLLGTYDDGLSWLESTKTSETTDCVLSLGSSIGNFSHHDAAQFLRRFADGLEPNDFMIIGLDNCQDAGRILKAYDDSQGVTDKFYLNALVHANRLLGFEAFKQAEWKLFRFYDELAQRHNTSFVAEVDVQINKICICAGTNVNLEDVCKYSPKEYRKLWHESGLKCRYSFANSNADYSIHMLSTGFTNFDTHFDNYSSHLLPSIYDWRELWAAWDAVTRGMTSDEELWSKPIALRNDLIFYLGHIPTFCDIHLSRALQEELTHPASFSQIFERGIDPDVNDPDQCHDHSAAPDVWPPLQDINRYQDRVRARLTSIFASGRVTLDRKLQRAIWLAFEHETMHLETYLVMLLQGSTMKPPPSVTRPDFQRLAERAAAKAKTNQWFQIPQTKVTIGMDDAEDDLTTPRHFGWDNEKPARRALVHEFEAQARPITNGEYAKYLHVTSSVKVPASWVNCTSDGKASNHSHGSEEIVALGLDVAIVRDTSIRTAFGLVPLCYALYWPVMASYDELTAYAAWAGGRIPTLEEARSIYSHVDIVKQKKILEKVSSSLISAVNGHLVNNGVEETPPQGRPLNGFPVETGNQNLTPQSTFVDLAGCNVGFKNWTPSEVVSKGNHLCGQSDMAGAWEWTSTTLAKWDGFKAQQAYPGYTADFFDGKHNIVLGGSWATHPRIAGRKTFINWYQRNYPFTWAGARLVRDIDAST